MGFFLHFLHFLLLFVLFVKILGPFFILAGGGEGAWVYFSLFIAFYYFLNS